MIALLFTALNPAMALPMTQEVCINIDLDFADTLPDTDFWSTNAVRPMRGIWTEVCETANPSVCPIYGYTEDVGSKRGCVSGTVDTTKTYSITVKSDAKVKNRQILGQVDTKIFPGQWSSASPVYTVLQAAFTPNLRAGSVTRTLTHDITEPYGAIAVASWIFYRNNFGIPANKTIVVVTGRDSFAQSGGEIWVETDSRWTVSHEVGHWIGYMRDGEQLPRENYALGFDGCETINAANSGAISWMRYDQEWHSAAAVDGFADFIAAWTWNSRAQSDCVFSHIGYSYDLDNNGTGEPNGGNCFQLSCDQDPWDINSNGCIDQLGCLSGDPRCCATPQILDCGGDTYGDGEPWVDPFITDGSWLREYEANVPSCSFMVNTGAAADWTSFFWNMTTDEGLSVRKIVDIYDAMNPRTWEPTSYTVLANTPTHRLEAACLSQNCTQAYRNQRYHGVDLLVP